MKRIKQAFVSLGVTLTIVTGGLFVSAPAANAYTDTFGWWQYNCQYDTRSWMVWRDYNWWEETFQWKRDGWVQTTVQYYPC